MFIILRSSTQQSTHVQERPVLLGHSDFKSSLINPLCRHLASCLSPGAILYARIPGSAEETITPSNNTYAIIAAIDRGCDHLIVDVPDTYGTSHHRVHFTIEEL